MMQIDTYLPDYDFNEVHKIIVKGNQKDCYQTAFNLDLSKSSIIRVLFILRGLPFKHSKLNEITQDMKFTLLEEDEYNEFLYGFWAKSKVNWITDKEAFINERNGYQIKSVWNFTFKKLNVYECEITTETRVKCMTKKSKLLFSFYWFFIKPFSGLIRIKMLKLIQDNLK